MVLVQIEEGILEGEHVGNEYGKPYYSFKGIPYAEPPLGNLRFKPPKPVKPWSGVRPAKTFGSRCYQRDVFEQSPPSGCEDCLYINVYSSNLKPKKPLPVMFWIHGGGYVWGSGEDNMYGPEFLINHDVVLVTFNYRLGVLGYLCLNTPDVPGNAGMKDQVLALRWVKKNISRFGGDPNNVTIFGESAGGASVAFHLISPMSKGLFKRAIIQSASLTSYWTTIWCPREKADKLARQLGCNSEDDKELYEFFRNQPFESFLNIDLHVTQAKKPYGLHLAVVREKDFGDNERFFYGDVYEWLRKGIDKDVEVMMGYNEHEGLLGLAANAFCGDIDKLCAYGNEFVEFYIPEPLAVECPLIKQLEIGKKFKKIHTKDGIVNLENLLSYITIDFFVFDIILMAKFLSKNNKTYLYKMTCKSERNQMKNIFGLTEYYNETPVVCHSDDLPYLFPVKLLKQTIDVNSETFQIINNVTSLWTNFSKHGEPTPDSSLGVKWSQFSIDRQDYLDIGNKLIPRAFPEKEFVDFWESVYKEYLPRCVAYN